MKLLLLSDVHAKYQTSIGRKDNIGEAFESKMDFVFKYAEEHNAIILQAGDLNDNARNWNVLNYFIKRLKKHLVTVLCVFGQHDFYMRRKSDGSPGVLSILIENGMITALNWKPITIGVCRLFGASWGDRIPTPKNNDKINILVLHAPISKKGEYPGHDYTSPEKFLAKHKMYDIVLVGDIHKKIYYRKGDRYLINTGPMLRVEATEYNMRHRPCFYIYDTTKGTIKKVIIPHKPSSEVLTRDHIIEKNISTTELEQFATTIKSLPNVGNQRRKNTLKFIRKVVKKDRVLILKLAKEVMDGKFDPIVRGKD